MKIKRFVAPDVRTAMKQLREELGADAVILSNKRVDNNVEIVAAVDYDEREVVRSATNTLAPSAITTPEQPAVASQSAVAPQSVVASQPAVASHSAVAPQQPAEAPQESASLVNRQSRQQPRQQAPQALHQQSHQEVHQQPNQQPDQPPNQQQRQQVPEQQPPSIAAKIASASNADIGEAAADGSLADLYRELSNLRGLLEGELAHLAWRDTAGKPTIWSTLYNRLVKLGLSRNLCDEVLTKAKLTSDLESSWQAVLQLLGDFVSVTGDELLNEGGVIALVGSTGVGKSTTIAKLAARFALRHGRNQVALITTDCYRIGGQEQLETFAKILGVPVVMATTEQDIKAALEAFANRKLVLIDTAGMSQRDIRLSEQFSTLQNVGYTIQSYVVLSATAMPAVVNEVVKTFDKDQLAGAIVTKVDESTSLGQVLSTLINYKLPVSYIGNGQRVPEDIVPARADVLVNTAAEIALVEQLNDNVAGHRAAI